MKSASSSSAVRRTRGAAGARRSRKAAIAALMPASQAPPRVAPATACCTVAIVCSTRAAQVGEQRSARSTCAAAMRRRPRGVGGHRLQVGDDRPDVLLELRRQPGRCCCAARSAEHDDGDLDRRPSRRTATAMTPRKTSLTPPAPPPRRACWYCSRAFSNAFDRSAAPFARALAEILARLVAGGRREEQRHRRAGHRAGDERHRASAPDWSFDMADPQKRLTRTFRYFLGSARMSCTRLRSSLTAPFMFSYNCLSCSSWPAVPSPCCSAADHLVEPVGHRVQPVVQRRRRSPACRPCPRPRLIRPVIASRLAVVDVSDLRQRVVVQQLARGCPRPARMRAVIASRFCSDASSALRRRRVVRQPAERAAALVDVAAPPSSAAPTKRVQLAVERVVGEQLARRCRGRRGCPAAAPSAPRGPRSPASATSASEPARRPDGT